MENKAELSAARRDVEALSLDEDPLVVAQARVDKLTAILARLLNDDDATIATMALARERLTVALALLETLLKTRAARTTPPSTSGPQQVDFRGKRPPEKTPRMAVSTSGEPFDLPDYLSQVERHWTANMFSIKDTLHGRLPSRNSLIINSSKRNIVGPWRRTVTSGRGRMPHVGWQRRRHRVIFLMLTSRVFLMFVLIMNPPLFLFTALTT
jgi:hypothetical protein